MFKKTMLLLTVICTGFVFFTTSAIASDELQSKMIKQSIKQDKSIIKLRLQKENVFSLFKTMEQDDLQDGRDVRPVRLQSEGNVNRDCSDCEFDFTNYGSECCDSAWDEYGIDCATLEANYSWDCSGCNCPGDGGTTGGDACPDQVECWDG